MKKQLELFPELDLSSKEPIIYDGASGQLINKFKEKEVGPFETALNNVQNKGKRVPVRKPIAVEVEAGKKYFFCSCGESANQPFCDGAHSGTDFQPLAFTAEKTGKAYLCQCKKSSNAPYCNGSHSSIS